MHTDSPTPGRFSCDSERLTFLRALDEAVDVEVNEWEKKFIKSNTIWHTGAVLFTEPQRARIDELARKYGGRL